MTLAKIKSAQKSTLNKSNKNIEINMSTLSTAQKQMCLRLLAESNVNFSQNKTLNHFQAYLKIDPVKLASQLNEEKQRLNQLEVQQLNFSPIKKNQPSNSKKYNKTAKENNLKATNTNYIKTKQKIEIKKIITPSISIYKNSKKTLSKTIKINLLSQLQILYPFIELYVYPKRMSFQNLIQLIEQIYDLYWIEQINILKNKNQQHNFSFDNNSKPIIIKQSKKQSFKNKINNNTIDKDNLLQIKQQNKTFCKWIFQNFIHKQKQKMKFQQLLVNFVQSLNHFCYKNIGIQIFYNFFSGVYNLQTLHYYLVIRAVLQQLEGQKIRQKQSNYSSKSGILYKMRLNPYNKNIQEEKVHSFLEICCQTQKKIKKQQQIIHIIFNQMTLFMFFDQKKKKNFIPYFQMVDVLLRDFLKVQTVNTTNLELSYTENGSSLNHQFFYQRQQLMGIPEPKQEQNLQLTFEVHEKEQQQRDDHDQLSNSLPNELNLYLPCDYSKQLELRPESQNTPSSSFQSIFFQQLIKKYQRIRCQLSQSLLKSTNRQRSQQILQKIYECIVKTNKKKWIEYLLENQLITKQKQLDELYFIETLEAEYHQIKQANVVSNKFIKKIFTVPYIRLAILHESNSFD